MDTIMSDAQQSMTEAERDGFIFRKSMPMQMDLQEVLAALGDAGDLVCLEIGSSNAMFSYQLRRAGGHWHSLVADDETAARVREVVEDHVGVLPPEGEEPFAKHTFDAVIVLGMLEAQTSDAAFVKRCHRMLKPEGRLIVCAARQKSLSLLNPVRGVLQRSGQVRTGYTESRLFAALKSGFDVSSLRTYQRFFMALTAAVVESMDGRRSSAPAEARCRLYKVASVFFWFAFQFDALLFLTRGHRMIAVAKRRGWRSREAPVLSDGRTISEAVLKPIG
jgi:SAM-dependent methyltransferase